eukprot:jgi/Galph1/113/GphlegSOOS_G4846.1
MDSFDSVLSQSSSASFWALELPPQKKETLKVDIDRQLHLTMASFGTKLIEKERTPISMQVKNSELFLSETPKKEQPLECTLCVLLPEVVESIPLNVLLSEDTSVTFINNSKKNTVYLTGYMTMVESTDSDEEFGIERFGREEEDSEEEEDESEASEEELPVKVHDDNKSQKEKGTPKEGKAVQQQTPSKKIAVEEEDDSSNENLSMDSDMSNDFEMDEDEEESEEDEPISQDKTQKSQMVGKKRNEASAAVSKQPGIRKPSTQPQQPNQKKQNNGHSTPKPVQAGGTPSAPNSQQKLTPSQKKRLRKKRKKMEQQTNMTGSS